VLTGTRQGISTLTGIVLTLSLRGACAEAISCLTSVPRLVRQGIASAQAPRNDRFVRVFPLMVKIF